MEITGELKQNGIPSLENPVKIDNENYLIIKDENGKVTDKIYKEKNGKGYIRKTKYKTIEIEVEELGWK